MRKKQIGIIVIFALTLALSAATASAATRAVRFRVTGMT